MSLAIVAAIDVKTGAIGAGNKLPWVIPEDLKRFRRITIGQAVIMGMKTYRSLNSKPLGGRFNIVMTKRPYETKSKSVVMVGSLREAIAVCYRDHDRGYVIGGTQIYKQTMPLIDKMYLTLVNRKEEEREGDDAYFPGYPDYIQKNFHTIEQEPGGENFSYLTLERN